MYMKNVKSVFLAALLAAGLSGPVSCAAIGIDDNPARGEDIHPPFDVSLIRALKGAPDERPFTCADTPRAMQDLVFDSFYEKGDKSASHVDKDAMTTYKAAIKPLSEYESTISAMANRYLRSAPPRTDIARCTLLWLDRWARQDALLGAEITPNGEFVRKWALAALSSSYLQIQDSPDISKKHKARVEKWLRRVADAVMADYSRDTGLRSRRNNHLYWAAWSVAIASAALDDRRMLDWALDKGRFGIDQIAADGTLPLELDRKGKALHYHAFAAGPLVLLAEIGMANGIGDLYTRNDRGLERLVDRVLEGLDDPAWFAHRTDTPQNLTGTMSTQNLGWIVPYAERFSDPKAKAWIARITPPVIQRRTGGDSLLLYGRGTDSAPSPESYVSEPDTDVLEP